MLILTIPAIDSNDLYLNLFFSFIIFYNSLFNRKVTHIKFELFSGICVSTKFLYIYIFLRFYIHACLRNFQRLQNFKREQFGILATWFREREYIFPAFCLDVAMPSIRAVSNVRYEGRGGGGGWGRGGGERDKKREARRRRNTWPSAWLAAAHSWSRCCASKSPHTVR